MREWVKTVLLPLLLCGGGVYLGLTIAASPDLGAAFLAGGFAVCICLAFVFTARDDGKFLLRLTLIALGLRWLVGWVIYSKGLWMSLGPDAATFDYFGNAICEVWRGVLDPRADWFLKHTSVSRSGWGMSYYVAGIYWVVGRNPLAVQLINCALGAMLPAVVYHITRMVYPNRRVMRLAAVVTALSPSMILWSAQGLKEAPLMLSLGLTMLLALRLRHRFGLRDFALLVLSLFCVYALRNYTFFLIFISISGGLLLSSKRFTLVRTLQGGLIILLLGLTFAYFQAGKVIEQPLDWKRVLKMREGGAKTANSSFGTEKDVDSSETAITYLPVGVVYVLFAPFPWMVRNMTQLVALPEMVLWWIAFPLLIKGYWFALRRRTRESFMICLFTIGLTLFYALYQTNFGTLHRQRAQLLFFFYIFIGIGWDLWRQAKHRPTQITLSRPGYGALVPAQGAMARCEQSTGNAQ